MKTYFEKMVQNIYSEKCLAKKNNNEVNTHRSAVNIFLIFK